MRAAVSSDLQRERVAVVWEAGAARWPAFEVRPEDFAAHVEGLELADCAIEHAGDLLLACACLRGDQRALAELGRLLRANVPAFVRRIDAAPAFADEVHQRLLERLLHGPTPRLGRYAGAGPLLGWLRVVTVRIAIDVKRDQSGRLPPLDQSLDGVVAQRVASPEVNLIKATYRDDLQRAVALGLARLTSRQRAVLRLYLMGGLNIDELGKLYAVHRSTVARWISSAERSVFDTVREHLADLHHLTTAEVLSLAGLVRSQVELSLERHL
jgi:RNA polymerase sigma-70 factor (ECF subfamily)